MNPIFQILLIGLIALAAILLLAAVLTAVLIACGKRISQKQRQAEESYILERMPGTDCGQCGCDTCKQFAQQLLEDAVAVEACPALQDEKQEQLAAFLEKRRIEQQESLQRLEKSKQERRKKRFFNLK